jgi:uncharacterized protein YrrD
VSALASVGGYKGQWCKKGLSKMRFKQGATVSTYDDKNLGTVDRVVLNPKTKEVTHIIVRKGFLFSEDKLIPLDLVALATEDKVTLRQDATDLDKLPIFEEVHYIPLDETEARTAEYPVCMGSARYL